MPDVKQVATLLKISAWILIVSSVWIFITCTGRGVDVGNPVQGFAVQGFVLTPDKNPATGAQVVLGIARENELDTIFQTGACQGQCAQIITYQYVMDTVETDGDGWFLFDNVLPAEYVLVASFDTLASYDRITHTSRITDLDLNVTRSHNISLATGSLTANGEELKFFVVQNSSPAEFVSPEGLNMDEEFLLDFRIKGTEISGEKTTGMQVLNHAPHGLFDLVLFDVDSNRFEIPYNNNGFGCDIYLADQDLIDRQGEIEFPIENYSGSINLEKWVSNGCLLNNSEANPEVIWSLPQNESQGVRARIDAQKGVQLSIQFSHPMNRNPDLEFLSILEPENIQIDTVKWQGHDLVDITFCTEGSPACSEFKKFKVGQKYSVEILSSAASYYGNPLQSADTIWFIPEPFPRVGTVQGFGKSVLASHDDADITPEEVFLGLDIHPSEAFMAGNELLLETNGQVDPATLGTGITCLEADLPIVCGKSAYDGGIRVTFENEFKAPEHYQVILDTTLTFEGMAWPKNQIISWYTRRL